MSQHTMTSAPSSVDARIAVRLSDAEMAAMDTSPDGLSVARTSLNSCATTTRGTGRRKRVRAKSNGAWSPNLYLMIDDDHD